MSALVLLARLPHHAPNGGGGGGGVNTNSRPIDWPMLVAPLPPSPLVTLQLNGRRRALFGQSQLEEGLACSARCPSSRNTCCTRGPARGLDVGAHLQGRNCGALEQLCNRLWELRASNKMIRCLLSQASGAAESKRPAACSLGPPMQSCSVRGSAATAGISATSLCHVRRFLSVRGLLLQL